MNAMNNQKEDARNTSMLFSYKGSKYFMIAVLVINCFFFFLAFAVIQNRQGSVSVGEIVLYSLFSIFFIFGLVAIMGKSDIVVNEQSVSSVPSACPPSIIEFSPPKFFAFLTFP